MWEEKTMPREPIAVDPGLSLADIESTVGQQEELLGALLTIENDGTNSLFTFDEEHDPEPDQLVKLSIVPLDRITVPAGFDLVCEGDAFVAGQLVRLAAFRADAAGSAPHPIPPAPAEDLLTNALRIALRVNETGNNSPYKLSFAKKGESGGSFGFTQGDLAGKQQIVQDTFRQVLAAAGIPDNNITGRLSKHVTQNPLTAIETAQVEAALSSPQGQRLVDGMDEAIFSELRKELDRCIETARPHRTIEPVAQTYMLLWINMTGKPTKLLDWLGGSPVTLHKLVPAPGPVVDAADIEGYLLSSKFFTENPRNFPHLRQSVAAGAAVLKAGHPLVVTPDIPPPGARAPAAIGPVRLSGLRGIDLKATLAIRQLVEIVGDATRALPDDCSVVVTSTLRPGSRVAGTGGISRHATGEAIDVQIIDPARNPIPNKGPDTTGLYQVLAIAAYHANERLFPERHGQLAWGGNFTTGRPDGPRDLMHFDYGGDRGRFGTLARLVARDAGVA
jgi:hypothetical protein